MLWDRCGRAAWAEEADAGADTATVGEHGGRDASGSMVRQLPSFAHPAGSHLRLLGLLGVKQRAQDMPRSQPQAHRPNRRVRLRRRDSQLSPYLR
jgi:hypothetical protein